MRRGGREEACMRWPRSSPVCREIIFKCARWGGFPLRNTGRLVVPGAGNVEETSRPERRGCRDRCFHSSWPSEAGGGVSYFAEVEAGEFVLRR